MTATGGRGPLAFMLTVLLFASFTAYALARETLTNANVLALVKAGLSESVIVAKIRASEAQFDTSTDALIALKEAGVPDGVLEAMVTTALSAPAGVEPPAGTSGSAGPAAGDSRIGQPPGRAPPGGGGGATTVAAPAPPGAPASMVAALPPDIAVQFGRAPVYQLVNDQYVELNPSIAEVRTESVFFHMRSELVLPGQRATYRMAERQPVFVAAYSPSEMVLVRLKPGDEQDRLLEFGSGAVIPFWGMTQRQGVRAEDRIPVDVERDPQRGYRFRPRAPLPAGEYGLILTQGHASGTTSKVYDFGVD